MHYVYCIYCPETRKPKYVGTTVNVETRMAQHLTSSHSSAIYLFMQDLRSRNLKPVCKVLKSFDNQYYAADFEKKQIEDFIELGEDLLNHRYNKSKKKKPEYLTEFEDLDLLAQPKD